MTLQVGSTCQPFSIHKNLLCASSTYFARRLHGSSAQVVELKDVLASGFKLFAEYLYTKSVPKVQMTASPVARGERLRDLCALFVFTEQYEVPRVVGNKVMDAIQDGFYATSTFPDEGLVLFASGP